MSTSLPRSSSNEAETIPDFIDGQGIVRFHKHFFLIGGSGYFFDALDVASISFVLPAVAAEWHLTLTQTGSLGSSTFVGYFFGALLAGICGDRFGRKPVMIAGLVIYCVAALGCAFSGSLAELLLLRGAGGFGIGMESVIIAPYLTEFVPRAWRGRFAGGMAGCMSFGFLTAAILGYLIVPSGPDGWRLFMALCGAPIILAFWWGRVLRESPLLLSGMGKSRQAETILRDLYGTSPDLSAGGKTVTENFQSRSGLGNLFLREHRRAIVTGCTLWFFLTMAYYAFFTWVPQLLVLSGVSISKSIYHSIGTFGAQIPGYFFAAWLNDRIGARKVIIVFMIGAALTCSAISVAPTPEMITFAGLVLSFFLNGCYAAAYPFTPFLFPAHLRARGMGLSSSVGRFGAIAAPLAIGHFYSVLGLGGVFGAIGLVLLCGVGALILIGHPARRDGGMSAV